RREASPQARGHDGAEERSRGAIMVAPTIAFGSRPTGAVRRLCTITHMQLHTDLRSDLEHVSRPGDARVWAPVCSLRPARPYRFPYVLQKPAVGLLTQF